MIDTFDSCKSGFVQESSKSVRKLLRINDSGIPFDPSHRSVHWRGIGCDVLMFGFVSSAHTDLPLLLSNHFKNVFQ